jgi:hypothetical protein
MSVPGVRRAKAALSSGCKSHPATAPAGSDAWNSEAFDLVQDGPAPEWLFGSGRRAMFTPSKG